MNGRVAVVTGAASGLGLETAKLLSCEGASLVLVDLDEVRGTDAVEDLVDSGGEAVFVRADVRSRSDMARTVRAAEDKFGHLDCLVANAGILGEASFRESHTVSEDAWADILDVNLTGTFNSLMAAAPALRRAGGGTMSVTSSVASKYAVLYAAAYSATKGGVDALTRSLAVEWAPDRIRVNALAVGTMASNLGDSLGAGRSRDNIDVARPDQKLKSRMIDDRRLGAAEAARVHLFLNCDLSSYISGESITVDGGYSIWNGM